MAEQRKGFGFVTDPRSVEWKGMPEFIQEDLTPWHTIYVHFTGPGDMAAFAKLVEQNITQYTRQIWYPKAEIGHFINKRYKDES